MELGDLTAQFEADFRVFVYRRCSNTGDLGNRQIPSEPLLVTNAMPRLSNPEVVLG